MIHKQYTKYRVDAKNSTVCLCHALVFSVITFIASCNNSSTPVLSSYQSQSVTKSAILYEPDRKTPAAGAIIKFFDLTTDNDSPAASFVTDQYGRYSIKELPAGEYHLWAEKDSLVLFHDSIRVTADSATICNDTLHYATSLSGVVSLLADHDPRTVTLRVAHSGKRVKVTAIGGEFIIQGLAKGTHLLRGECSVPGYAPFIKTITVHASSHDTLKDTVRMIYGGIPIVVHPVVSFDTLAGTVQLSWDRTVSSSLQDYLIYKSVCNDFGFSDTVFAVTKDTFFVDRSYAGRSANPLDTLQQCVAYRIAVRTATQEIGPPSRSVTIPVVPKSFVTTFLTSKIRYGEPNFDRATINDTVLLSVTARNRTHHLTSMLWYDNRKKITIATLNTDTLNAKTVSDSIAVTFDSLGTNPIRVYAYDEAGNNWTTLLSIQIVADKPAVTACNDTGVLIGSAVHLHGSARQQFGSIEKWEWKLDSDDWIQTSTSDTIITAPLLEQITVCSLAVTDDDGYREMAAMRIFTSLAAQAVAACSSYSFILKTDNTLMAFGRGDSGQLGDGSSISQRLPTAVMSAVQCMSVGSLHCMIIRTDGTLWACGDNSYGQLGDGTHLKRNPPIPVMSDVAKVATGNTHSLILKIDGTLWACGNNSCGQLGDGTKENRSTPVNIMSGVMSIAAGAFHSVILKTDGTVWTCGENGGGQLGTGTTEDLLTPVQVMSSVKSVAASSWNSLFLTISGELWGCGNNGYGQLGDGTIERQLKPVKVMSGIKDMAASANYSLILTTESTLLVCGLNPTGQGWPDKRYAPFPIMTNVKNMAAGLLHCLILKTDGTVWACGQNSSGQLGDGTQTDRTTPVCIIPPQQIEEGY